MPNYTIDPNYDLRWVKHRDLTVDILWYLADHGGRIESDWRVTDDLFAELDRRGHVGNNTTARTYTATVARMVEKGQIGRITCGKQTRALWLEGDTLPPRHWGTSTPPAEPSTNGQVLEGDAKAAALADLKPADSNGTDEVTDTVDLTADPPTLDTVVPVVELAADTLSDLLAATPQTIAGQLSMAANIIHESLCQLATIRPVELSPVGTGSRGGR